MKFNYGKHDHIKRLSLHVWKLPLTFLNALITNKKKLMNTKTNKKLVLNCVKLFPHLFVQSKNFICWVKYLFFHLGIDKTFPKLLQLFIDLVFNFLKGGIFRFFCSCLFSGTWQKPFKGRRWRRVTSSNVSEQIWANLVLRLFHVVTINMVLPLILLFKRFCLNIFFDFCFVLLLFCHAKKISFFRYILTMLSFLPFPSKQYLWLHFERDRIRFGNITDMLLWRKAQEEVLHLSKC